MLDPFFTPEPLEELLPELPELVPLAPVPLEEDAAGVKPGPATLKSIGLLPPVFSVSVPVPSPLSVIVALLSVIGHEVIPDVLAYVSIRFPVALPSPAKLSGPVSEASPELLLSAANPEVCRTNVLGLGLVVVPEEPEPPEDPLLDAEPPALAPAPCLAAP